MLLNDNQIRLEGRAKVINRFQNDLTAIFVQHFSYLFYLNDHYIMSADYVEYLDMGMTREEDSQYWVALFIQEAFDKNIKGYRLDIANELKAKTAIKLK